MPTDVALAAAAGVDVVAGPIETLRGGLTDEHLRRMLDSGVALTPTLTLLGAGGNAEEILDQVSRYLDMGGEYCSERMLATTTFRTRVENPSSWRTPVSIGRTFWPH